MATTPTHHTTTNNTSPSHQSNTTTIEDDYNNQLLKITSSAIHPFVSSGIIKMNQSEEEDVALDEGTTLDEIDKG